MQFKDYYRTLGISREATAEEIKQAFRKLARQYHLGVSKEKDADQRMKEVNEAYTVLSDPEKRAAYDQPARRTGTRASSSRERASRRGRWLPSARTPKAREIYEAMARELAFEPRPNRKAKQGDGNLMEKTWLGKWRQVLAAKQRSPAAYRAHVAVGTGFGAARELAGAGRGFV